MDAQRRYFQLTLDRAMVQRFDVGDDMLERQTGGIEFAMRQRIKHECVIGVGAVSNTNFSWLHVVS